MMEIRKNSIRQGWINSNENRPKTVVFDFGLIYNKFIGVKSETIGVRAVGR